MPRTAPAADVEVWPLEERDLRECEDLCLGVHGFERTKEVRDAIRVPALAPVVAVREDRVTAYATTLTFFPAAHAVAESDDDMRALILGALAADHEPTGCWIPSVLY